MSVFSRIRDFFSSSSTGIIYLAPSYFGRSKKNELFSSAFAACAGVKADTLSILPGHAYKKKNAKRELTSTPLDRFFDGKWNDSLTATEGLRWLSKQLDLKGNAYIYVKRAGTKILGFYQLNGSMSIQIDRDNKKLVYNYYGDNFVDSGSYTSRDILHFKSKLINDDGILGISPAQLAAASINMSFDMDTFYDRVLNGGQHAPGWLEIDKDVKQIDIKKIQENLKNSRGAAKAGEVPVYPPGITYHSGSMTMIESDLTNQQRANVEKICQHLGVPPYMIYSDASSQKYANAQEASLNFIKFTIAPIAKNIEHVLNSYLQNVLNFTDAYVKYDLNGIMRGDFLTRVQAYQILVQAGIYTPNEIRALEDMDPFVGGDYLRLDLNAGRILTDGSVEVPTSDKQNNRALAQSEQLFNSYVSEAKQRVIARVEKDGATEKNLRFARDTAKPLELAALLSQGQVSFNTEEFISETTTERTTDE